MWAAALAANWDRKIKDLVNDIYGDHNYMVSNLVLVKALHLGLHGYMSKQLIMFVSVRTVPSMEICMAHCMFGVSRGIRETKRMS